MSAPLTAVCSTPRHPSLLALLPSPSHKLHLYPPPASLPLPAAVAPSATLRAPPSLVPLSHPPSLLAASPGVLAVGYQGLPTALLWNLARGVHQSVALPAPPLALACSGSALYSLARGEAVLEERPLSTLLLSRQIKFGGRVAEGRKVALSAAGDGSSVAVAGRKDRVKVLDLKDGSKIANYDFPNVSFVTHLSPSLLLVSSSSSMSLYNLTDPDAPPLTLPLPSAAIQATLSPDGNSFLAVTSCGTVLHAAASPSAPNPPSTSAPSAAVGAAFLNDSSAVVYSLTGGGSSVAAVALPLDLSDPVLSLPPLEQSADAPTKPAASPKRAANELQQSVQGAGDRGSTAPAQELKRRRAEADAAEEGDDGPTVADRLATLSSALDADSDEEDGGLPEGAARPDFSKADSLGLLLGQALTSNDDAQLEVCFSCHDKAVILATVKSLTPANVMGLLAKVVDRISRRPARAQVLGAWLLCLMKAHAATFLSNEVLARKLAPVQGLLRERTETMGDLIRLDGRLGVLEFLM